MGASRDRRVISKVLKDIDEALNLETHGVKVDMVPKGCSLVKSQCSGFYFLNLSIYGASNGKAHVMICFPLNPESPISVAYKGKPYHLSKSDMFILEEMATWLWTEGRFKRHEYN